MLIEIVDATSKDEFKSEAARLQEEGYVPFGTPSVYTVQVYPLYRNSQPVTRVHYVQFFQK